MRERGKMTWTRSRLNQRRVGETRNFRSGVAFLRFRLGLGQGAVGEGWPHPISFPHSLKNRKEKYHFSVEPPTLNLELLHLLMTWNVSHAQPDRLNRCLVTGVCQFIIFSYWAHSERELNNRRRSLKCDPCVRKENQLRYCCEKQEEDKRSMMQRWPTGDRTRVEDVDPILKITTFSMYFSSYGSI